MFFYGDVLNMNQHLATWKLFQALEHQSRDEIHQALAHGADVNGRDQTGRTPLMCAAATGDVTSVQCLLDAGAHVWDVDMQGRIPLLYTDDEDYCDVAAIIGAAMSEQPNPEWFADALAQFADGHLALVVGVLATGVDGNGFPFFVAIQSDDSRIVEAFLQTGVDVNQINNQSTPLIHAIGGGNPEIVRMLIAAGADVNQHDLQGRTPLHFTYERHRRGVPEEDWQEIIRMLQDAGARNLKR